MWLKTLVLSSQLQGKQSCGKTEPLHLLRLGDVNREVQGQQSSIPCIPGFISNPRGPCISFEVTKLLPVPFRTCFLCQLGFACARRSLTPPLRKLQLFYVKTGLDLQRSASAWFGPSMLGICALDFVCPDRTLFIGRPAPRWILEFC